MNPTRLSIPPTSPPSASNSRRKKPRRWSSFRAAPAASLVAEQGWPRRSRGNWRGRAPTDRSGWQVTGCLGFCDREPIVIVRPQGFFYPQPKPADVKEIVAKSVLAGQPVERLFLKDPQTGQPFRTKDEIPFYKDQTPVLFSANFDLDPTSIEDYIRIGGYGAFGQGVDDDEAGGNRPGGQRIPASGRGGAGFPTGSKWASCRKAKGNLKYVICNADEGDPGAYANRGLMEGNPHSIVEGMIIGAYAIGSSRGLRLCPHRISHGRDPDRQGRRGGTPPGPAGREHSGQRFPL